MSGNKIFSKSRSVLSCTLNNVNMSLYMYVPAACGKSSSVGDVASRGICIKVRATSDADSG